MARRSAQVLFMPVTRRIVHQLYVLSLLAALPLLLTQCGAFKPRSQKDRSAETAAVDTAAVDTESSAESGDDKEEETESTENQRRIAVDQTPFFRWLRSGLRSNAKPSSFLSKGDMVELLKEDEEEKFSRIRLENGKKGWVPSRLLKEVEAESSTESVAIPSTETTPETPTPSVPDSLTPAEPPTLPNNPSEIQPTLKADEISQPMFPQFGIIQPKRTPREVKEPEPTEGSDATPNEAPSPAPQDN